MWCRAPLWESCSSELHWLVVSFQMAAMDPVRLFLLHWFRGSICGLPHYCSRISKSTFFFVAPFSGAVRLGSDVAARSIEYRLTCSPSPPCCCRVDRCSYPGPDATYETATRPRLCSSHWWCQSMINLSPVCMVQCSLAGCIIETRERQQRGLNAYRKELCFSDLQTTKAKKKKKKLHKWRLTAQFPCVLGVFSGRSCQLLCQRRWAWGAGSSPGGGHLSWV